MIALGDAKQLPAIEQGGAFGAIVHGLGGFELTNIKRQERPEERERVKQLSRGETEAVLKSYAQEGKLHVARTHVDAQEKLIQDWARSGGLVAPKDHAIFAATNLEVRSLNDKAQRQRTEAGRLGCFQSVTVGEETFLGGDRVLFTKKSRKLAVENGDTGTIVAIRNNPLSAAVKVRFGGETKAREIPLRTLLQTHYDGLTRGYALTNLARQATGEGEKIKAKPGLKEEYSPLITQATKSNAKTLASDQPSPAGSRPSPLAGRTPKRTAEQSA